MRSNLWQVLLVLLLFIKSCYGLQCEFCEFCHIGNIYGFVKAIHDTVYVNDPLLNSNQRINVSNYDYDPNDHKKRTPI